MTQDQTLSAASDELSTQLITRNGRKIRVRPAFPADEQQVLQFLEAVEPDDLHLTSRLHPKSAELTILTKHLA